MLSKLHVNFPVSGNSANSLGKLLGAKEFFRTAVEIRDPI